MLSRSPVSLSSSSATLLLFLFVSLPLPLPLLATPAPDQYDAATAHHHGYQPKIRSIKFQSSETLQPLKESHDGQQHTVKLQQSGNVPSEAQRRHGDGQLHSIKLQHTGFAPSDSLLPLQTPQGNDKLSSDHNKKAARNARSVDASQIHRVKLAKSDYQTGSLLPFQVSQLTRKENDQKKNETIHYEGDDDITIDEVKSLDESLLENDDYNSPLEELDINVEDNNVPTLYSENHRRTKRETQEDTSVRQKRDFIRWYGASSFQPYQPQQTYISSYQLSARVPYYIPIWGNPSRIPVFFPIKPILFNPGYPVANRPQPNQPNIPNISEVTESPPTDGNVNIGNRNNFDEGQVWGVVETNPATNINGGVGSSAAQPPNTQNRKPPTPSLIHRPSRTDEEDDLDLDLPIGQVPNELNPSRPSQNIPQNPTRPSQTFPQNPTRPSQNFPQNPSRPSQNFPQNPSRPSQSFPQIPNDNRDPLFELSSTPRPIFTTRRPPPGNNQVTNQSREPSRCVWAVISCCSPISTNVRYSCFEGLGCDGSFWDGNPCSREYTTAALNAAQKFYQQNSSRR